MKKQSNLVFMFISMLVLLSSCSVVGGIFKTGMGVGIFVVILVIAIIIFIVSKMGNKN